MRTIITDSFTNNAEISIVNCRLIYMNFNENILPETCANHASACNIISQCEYVAFIEVIKNIDPHKKQKLITQSGMDIIVRNDVVIIAHSDYPEHSITIKKTQIETLINKLLQCVL